MHPSLRRTTHPRITHCTLSRRSIPTQERHTPSTRKPPSRILRARLPRTYTHWHILTPNSHPPRIPLTLTVPPHVCPSPLLRLNRRTRSPTSATRSRASRTSILAGRVRPSLYNRYASCWRTGDPPPTTACARTRALACGRGSSSVVILCGPVGDRRLGVY